MPKRKLEESASSALADGKTETADMQRALAATEQQTALNETLDPCVADNKDEWQQIKVQIVRPGYPTMCYSCNKNAPMQKLMNLYCMSERLDASATNFSASATNFSEKLEPLETFEQAGLANGDDLHVFA